MGTPLRKSEAELRIGHGHGLTLDPPAEQLSLRLGCRDVQREQRLARQ